MPNPTLDIFGLIGSYPGEVSTASVALSIAELPEDAERVTVRINSPGGSVFEGLGILNLLRAVGKPIDVQVIGLAASMASAIAMLGETVTMTADSMMMVHNPNSFAGGDSGDLRGTADLLDKLQATMVELYAARTGKTKAQITKLMDAETWMTAKQAKEEGFATAVVKLGDGASKAKNSRERVAALFSNYAHCPQEICAQWVPSNETPKSKPMNPEILKALGLSADATEADVVAATKALASAKAPTNVQPDLSSFVPRAEFERVQAEARAATAAIEAAAKAAHQRDVDEAIASALKDGKIVPAAVDFYRQTCGSAEGLAEFRKFVAVQPSLNLDKGIVPAANPTPDVIKLSPSMQALAKTMGVTEDQLKATIAEQASRQTLTMVSE